MQATYTKLRDGSWGVRVIGAAVTAGQSLTVNTKAGEAKGETIDRVLWSGDGASICSVVARKRHSCSECFGWIEPGESYERVWGKWDGSQDTFKTCPDCLALRDWTKAHVPCFCWQHGSLRDDARDVITDVCERNDVPGMWMEFGRLLIKGARRGRARRNELMRGRT